MRRELYLYWRVARADLAAARAAMQQFQQALVLGHAGLQARLLQRADEAGELVTLMETYALPAASMGIDEAMQGRVVDGGDAASTAWRTEPRHLEVFLSGEAGA
jgi:hypothetical protein